MEIVLGILCLVQLFRIIDLQKARAELEELLLDEIIEGVKLKREIEKSRNHEGKQ